MKYRIIASVLMLLVFAFLVALKANETDNPTQPPVQTDSGAKFD